ncbi:N-acetyltransferase [Sphingomonas sp. VNH70]|uniref:GNAT family N-acetyltransferase n=1 Tax=Sphingomonas silueang TaxID=3156617 RepID=UPI0032B326AB
MPDLVPLAHADPVALEALLDAAFGADRRRRTVYRVRAGLQPIADLSFALIEDGELVGSIQCWPVQLDTDGGGSVPLVMVGPVAVAPPRQGTGIGRRLMERAIAAAGADAPLMLMGDPDYYRRFGFGAARTARWRLPGPFEPHRLLARGAVPDAAGMIAARTTALV